MKKSVFFAMLLSLALSLPPAGESLAASPKLLGRHSYWATYRVQEGGQTVCYMSILAAPPEKKGRGDVTLMIAHRPSEGATDIVSYSVGARLQPGSSVRAAVGDKFFNLFTQADTAWARDQVTDRALAMALRAGYYVTFAGTLASGKKFADTVNLKGSAKAYEQMSAACGVPVLPVPAAARPAPPSSKSPGKRK